MIGPVTNRGLSVAGGGDNATLLRRGKTGLKTQFRLPDR
jgi:hypothetical protein